MTRHTHDELIDALGLDKILDDEDENFFAPPLFLVHVLYRALRSNGVETKQVLFALYTEPVYLAKFLTICGDNEVVDVQEFLGREALSADILKAWLARQSVKKMLKTAGVDVGEAGANSAPGDAL